MRTTHLLTHARKIAMLAALGAAPGAQPQEPGRPVTAALSFDTSSPGGEIPADFAGLSFEMERLLPGRMAAITSPRRTKL